jgi:hypothetical protein
MSYTFITNYFKYGRSCQDSWEYRDNIPNPYEFKLLLTNGSSAINFFPFIGQLGTAEENTILYGNTVNLWFLLDSVH